MGNQVFRTDIVRFKMYSRWFLAIFNDQIPGEIHSSFTWTMHTIKNGHWLANSMQI